MRVAFIYTRCIYIFSWVPPSRHVGRRMREFVASDFFFLFFFFLLPLPPTTLPCILWIGWDGGVGWKEEGGEFCSGVGLGVDSRDGPDGIVRSSWLVHSSASSPPSCATRSEKPKFLGFCFTIYERFLDSAFLFIVSSHRPFSFFNFKNYSAVRVLYGKINFVFPPKKRQEQTK